MADWKVMLWVLFATVVFFGFLRKIVRDGRAAYERTLATDVFPLAKNPAPLEARYWGPPLTEESK